MAQQNPRNKKTPSDFDMTKSDSKPEAEHSAESGTTSQAVKENTMEKDMANLCTSLSVSTQVFPSRIEDWLKDLNDYIRRHDRLLYSVISDYAFGLDPDASTAFETNAYFLLDYELRAFDSLPSPTEEQKMRKRIILKFYDHVNLATKQHRMFSVQQADVEAVVEEKMESALTKTTRDLTNQLVGLVAIFTALSFIVFGSISSLDSILTTLSKKPDVVLPTLIVSVAWAFCIINLLFAFMYFVLRIIKTDTNRFDWKNSVQKYPMVFLTNYILLFAQLLLLGSWAAINTGVGSKFYNWALAHGSFTFLSVLVLIILVMGVTGVILLWFYNAPLKRRPSPRNRHRPRKP